MLRLRGRLFAGSRLEAAPVNSAILRRLISASGLPASVHAIAATDESAAALFADPKTSPGYETSSVSLSKGLRISTTTMDRHVAAR